jgi:trans-aconitate 2-methyltransferase
VPSPVLEWFKGSALRPILERLVDAEQREFLAEYGSLLRSAYPANDFGTLLPFRRLFVVAQKVRR